MQNENTEQNENSENAVPMPFNADLSILTVGAERVPWLAALIETARDDLRPRDFAERHLVDEMAINKWRLLRVYGMEKAVYEHQLADFEPQYENEPHEDLYHMARAHSPEYEAAILTALSRLEARFHRQFLAALKMLVTLRRLNPFSLNPIEKVQNTCQSLSKSPSDPSTTPSPNNSRPSYSQ